jgi:hypothetical protein
MAEVVDPTDTFLVSARQRWTFSTASTHCGHSRLPRSGHSAMPAFVHCRIAATDSDPAMLPVL